MKKYVTETWGILVYYDTDDKHYYLCNMGCDSNECPGVLFDEDQITKIWFSLKVATGDAQAVLGEIEDLQLNLAEESPVVDKYLRRQKEYWQGGKLIHTSED